MDLSIIIPVYNEESKIRKDIISASEFLKKEGLIGEIIVVDSGSQDQSKEIAEKTSTDPSVSKRVISIDHNVGKGHAVREGFKVSKGKYVGFNDGNFGNFLIGAGGTVLGCTPLWLLGGGHYNNLMEDFSFDSSDDQSAILQGSLWWSKNYQSFSIGKFLSNWSYWKNDENLIQKELDNVSID